MSPQPNITPLIPPVAQERYRKAAKHGVAYTPRDQNILRELTKQIKRSDKKADDAKLVAAGAKKDAKEAKKDAKDAKEDATGAKGDASDAKELATDAKLFAETANEQSTTARWKAMLAHDDAFDAKTDAKDAKRDAAEAIVIANFAMQQADKQTAELKMMKVLAESVEKSVDAERRGA